MNDLDRELARLNERLSLLDAARAQGAPISAGELLALYRMTASLEAAASRLQSGLTRLETAPVDAASIPDAEIEQLHRRVERLSERAASAAEPVPTAPTPVSPAKETVNASDTTRPTGTTQPFDATPPTETAQPVGGTTRPTAAARPSGTTRPVGTTQPPAKSKTPRFSEGDVGKYAIGVLAGLLILSAAGTFIRMVWDYVPNILRFCALMGAGAAVSALGWRKVLRIGLRNGFWTGLTGVGAALLFLACIAGNLVWGLYGAIVTAVLLLLWFIVHFAAAEHLGSRVFYTLVYIGGAIAVTLSAGELAASPALDWPRQLGLLIPAAVMYGLGAYSIVKKPRISLGIIVFCYALFSISALSALAGRGDAHLLRLLCTGFSFAGLLLSPIAFEAKPRGAQGISVFWAILLSYTAHHFFTLWGMADSGAAVFTLLALTAAVALQESRWRIGLLWLSPVFMINAMLLSHDLWQDAVCLPAVCCVLLYAVPQIRRDVHIRRACSIVYGMTLLLHFTNAPIVRDTGIPFAVSCIALSLVPVLHYITLARRGRGTAALRTADLGLLLIALFPAISYFPWDGASFLPLFTLLAALHTLLLAQASGKEEKVSHYSEASAGMAAYFFLAYITALCVGLMSLQQGMFHTSRIAATATMMLIGILCVTLSLWRHPKTYGVLSAALLVLNHLYLWAVWEVGAWSLSAGVAGLTVAVILIFLGFRFRQKPFRLFGLVMTIFYVLQITVVDLPRLGDSTWRSALLLLTGGILCFGISFAYNRLDQRFGSDKEES